MKIIKVSELKPGVKFSKPVFVDEENILVPAGLVVKEKDIERLKSWGIEKVQTEGEILSETDEAVSDNHGFDYLLTEKDNKEIIEKYNNAVNIISRIFIESRLGRKVSIDDIDQVVNTLFPLIREKKDLMISLTLSSENTKDKLAQNAVNCMIISLIIGLNLKMQSNLLIHLAIAALLHDIGMNRIPDSILKKEGKLTPNELETVKTHTIYSYRIITRELRYPEEIGRIALLHHERWDGKGYPRQLSGKKILFTARIVSVADAFEAMLCDRPYRDSMIGYTAMKQILNDNARRFDPEIIKIFIKSMGIYPVGSIVILNNGIIGKVIKIHQNAPLRPEISILVDKAGKNKESSKRNINLVNRKELFIVRAINPKEIIGNKEK